MMLGTDRTDRTDHTDRTDRTDRTNRMGTLDRALLEKDPWEKGLLGSCG